MATAADGRTARAARTRAAIVDSLLALLAEEHLRPTGAQIAARAGVSERSVFQHFPNREALLAAVGERQAERAGEIIRPIDTALPAAARLDAFLAQRTAVLEILMPTRRAGRLLGDPPAQVDEVRARKRERVWAIFAPELAAMPAARRDAVRAAAGAAASLSTWEALRIHQGLPVEEARAAMRELLAGLLDISRE